MIENSVIANAIRISMTIFIVSRKFLIAGGEVVSFKA